MEGKARGCSSSEDSDDEVYLQNASDEDELGSSSGSMPKLQFRNMKSKGCWNEEMGMGEVIEKNGKMWVTTGIVRSGKIYSSIEETLGHPSRAEIEALERQCGGIPLKICLATEGRVSFFSFDKVELPVLP
ncbi:hypothetical protein AAZX31_19G124100 [Glycine max]|uniref:tRNA-splicing endonuclease subunit Sen54 N-terminal domain-containing protein n=2 Tax=Glycine max TaxID=3847 RepID=A0A0R0EY19_SOYBN|nr:uncharacterized protein LOC114399582 isoform X3 [Glycine soja]KAG4396204.1 hypothetical protein GLYMA_19G136600v4 [Glycine max]KRG95214.1 hypothetical protein GLYMA_19G136600v4 [Glycine max]